jgi:hypothetical protein
MGGWYTAGNPAWQARQQGDVAARSCGRWTAPDVALTVVAFVIHWELGLAFLALKLWQQASGYKGSVFSFAREKWEGLVATTRNLMAGAPSFTVGPRTSGNHAFDAWRRSELERIEAERAKLRTAEREFAAYRDQLLHAKDSEVFARFMQSRSASS